MTKRKDIDWAAIEAGYRAGKLSNRALAAEHGVSEAAIRKRAGEKGWTREPAKPAARPQRPERKTSPRPAAPAPDAPAAEEAVGEVLPPLQRALPPPAGATVIDAEPTGLVDHVLLLARRQLEELDATTSQLDDIEDAIYEETKDDRDGKRRSAMLKAVSLPARTMTLKTIAQVLELAGVAGGKQKLGKKEQKQGAAVEASRGRFAPRPPPKLVVDNG